LLVTSNAGIGGPTTGILVAEVVHHTGLELRLNVDYVKRNIEKLANPTGVTYVPDGAAGGMRRGKTVRLFTPKLHGNADDLIACLLE